MIVSALFFFVQTTLPFEVTSLWTGDTPHGVTVRREGSTLVVSGGGATARLKLENAEREWRLTLESEPAVGISLRREGEGFSMRYDASKDDRIVQSLVNHAFSYLSDSLYFPEENALYVFSGADVKVYGEAPSSGVRVTFSEFRRTLTIRRVDVPAQTARPVVERVKALLPPADAADSVQAWVSLYAWAGMALEGVDKKPEFDWILNRMPAAQPAVGEVLDTGTTQRSLATVPRIFVTHIKPESGRPYAVVTIFNYEPNAVTERFAFGDLGLNPTLRYHVFDFWSGRHWGSAAGSLAVPLSANGSRTLVITRDELRPSVLGESTSLFGAADSKLKMTWDEKSRTLAGSMRVRGKAPAFVFLSPYGDKIAYGKPEASFTGGSGKVAAGDGYVRLEVAGAPGGEVGFRVRFNEATKPKEPPKPEATVGASSAWSVLIEPKRSEGVAGWYVFRNDWLLGYVADGLIPDLDVDPGVPYTYTMVAVGYDGQLSDVAAFPARTPMPSDTPLTRLPMEGWSQPAGRPLLHRLENGQPATLDGAQGHALVVRQGSVLRYRVSRAFRAFSGTVGPDDSSPDGSTALFRIVADGEEIWNSGPVQKGAPVSFSVQIPDAYLLELIAEPVEGATAAQIPLVWLNPRLTAK